MYALDDYKQTDYYFNFCAILHIQKGLYLSEYIWCVDAKQLDNAFSCAFSDAIDFVAENRNINISEETKDKIAETIFLESENIFYDNINSVSFDDDIIKGIFRLINIYLNFSFLYEINDRIIDVTLTNATPPIKDYKTIAITIKGLLSQEDAYKIKTVLGTSTEQIITPSETIIKGFYSYKYGWRKIKEWIKEDC